MAWLDEQCPHMQSPRRESCCLCCDCPEPVCNHTGLSMRDCQDNGNGICDCFIDLEHEMTERALRATAAWFASDDKDDDSYQQRHGNEPRGDHQCSDVGR